MTPFQRLRLAITGFGVGIFLMGAIIGWHTLSIEYEALLFIALAISLYSLLVFASHGENADNKKVDAYTHASDTFTKGKNKD